MTSTIPMATRRLLLRPLTLGDAEAVQRLFPHWQIVRFLASHVPWPYPANGALSHIRDDALPAMARGEAWHWSLRLKADPEQLIGGISLMLREGDNRGLWLGLPWHGRGLMSEACEAVTDFWFDTLGQERLQVAKAAGNLPSRRLSERSGMRLVGTDVRDYVSGRLATELWETTRAEWQARRAGSRLTASP